MKVLTGVGLGACAVAAGYVVGGVDLAAAVFFAVLVAVMGVGSWELRRDRLARRVEVAQPVAQPVVSAPPAALQPVVTVNHYRRQSSPPVAMTATTGPQPADEDLQPPAQPPATGGGLIEALGLAGAAEWYQSMGREAAPAAVSRQSAGFDGDDLPTWAEMVAAAGALNGGGVDPAPAEAAVSAGDRPLLARVPPTMADYPLIAEVLEGSSSQNAAIRTLWGSKDGKVLGWLARVRDLYAEVPKPGRADIIGWELETGDDVVDVAERLGVSVEEVQAVFDGE